LLIFTRCFFLLLFVDVQRNELDRMYDNGVNELFDIGETRRALQARRSELLAECHANSKLQERFDQVAVQFQASAAATGPVASDSVKAASADSTLPAAPGPRREQSMDPGGYAADEK
jgi:hypothetical protein